MQALDDFYNDGTQRSDNGSECKQSVEDEQDNRYIVPNELFYEYEQIRKNQIYHMSKESDNDFTEEEIEDKIKYTFIHDKVVFDTLFNNALNLYGQRQETCRSWTKQTKAACKRSYSVK